MVIQTVLDRFLEGRRLNDLKLHELLLDSPDMHDRVVESLGERRVTRRGLRQMIARIPELRVEMGRRLLDREPRILDLLEVVRDVPELRELALNTVRTGEFRPTQILRVAPRHPQDLSRRSTPCSPMEGRASGCSRWCGGCRGARRWWFGGWRRSGCRRAIWMRCWRRCRSCNTAARTIAGRDRRTGGQARSGRSDPNAMWRPTEAGHLTAAHAIDRASPMLRRKPRFRSIEACYRVTNSDAGRSPPGNRRKPPTSRPHRGGGRGRSGRGAPRAVPRQRRDRRPVPIRGVTSRVRRRTRSTGVGGVDASRSAIAVPL